MSRTETTTAESERTAGEVALRKALSATPRPPRASAVSAAITFGWRGMLKVKHVPEQLLDVTITPVMFVLMFTYLFGGAIAGSTGAYLDYILPGILVMSVLFTTVYSGISLNTDLTKGVVDRFRSLPIWRPAPLVGALLGDSVRYALAGTVIIVLGLILGFRPEAGVGGLLAALALVVVFAFGLSWVFTTLGLLLRSPNAVMNAGFMGIFPLTFLSNVFVDPETLPSGLQAFVEINPISTLATASRGLMAGDASGADIAIDPALPPGLTAPDGRPGAGAVGRGDAGRAGSPANGDNAAAMGVTDDLLTNNARFAEGYDRDHLPVEPSLRLAVVTCMDSRLDVFAALGLRDGEAHVLRNAGGVITSDVIRSLALSQRKLGTREVVLIHHTDCGLEKVTDDGFRAELQEATGMTPPFAIESFSDVEEDVRQSLARVRATAFLPHRDRVRGFVYDVDTGLLREIDG